MRSGGTVQTAFSKSNSAQRASRIDVEGTEHKIPEAVPAFAAAWITAVLTDDTLWRGKAYEGDAASFRVHSGREEIKLPRPGKF